MLDSRFLFSKYIVILITKKLIELGINLPYVPESAGTYVPFRKVGNILYLSGSLCSLDGKLTHFGQVGKELTISSAKEAAKVCALNQLAIIKYALGTLDRVNQIIIVNGFVNAIDGFAESPQVINGASDFYLCIFGENGKHARTAVSVNGLPMNAPVEIQTVLTFDDFEK